MAIVLLLVPDLTLTSLSLSRSEARSVRRKLPRGFVWVLRAWPRKQGLSLLDIERHDSEQSKRTVFKMC
jgi:hypothetical protein